MDLQANPRGTLSRWDTMPRVRSGNPLLVLGCRPLWSDDGRLRGALARRLEAARTALGPRRGWFVVSGGRTWQGVVEADAMRDDLVRAGVPQEDILRERCSLSTVDNARRSSAILRRLGIERITLVTCEWHLPRAAEHFRREGLTVDLLPAAAPDAPWRTRFYRRAHEWLALRVETPRGVRT